jgi:hypothetical protein
MGFAVYHMEKGKGGSGGIGRHIDRIESKYGYTTYEHANVSMRDQNKEFILNEHCKKPLTKAIEDRIKEGYTQAKEIRKDAVKFQTHILTGSHEEMKDIFSSKATADKWLKENMDWICERYGKENIVRFTLHMDEKTPHIHAITVPITNDGRLSAKSYADGKKALREMQTDYAQRMEQFGLERGVERVGVKHESALEYYARNKKVDEYINQPNIKPIEPKKSFLRTNIDEIYKQNQDLHLLVGSFYEQLQKHESSSRELCAISVETSHRNKGLVKEKDRIIEKELNSLTSSYRKELERRKEQLSEQKELLSNPQKLIERANQIEEMRLKTKYEGLLANMEINIMVEAQLRLESGSKVTTYEIDNWIREFSPKEEVGVDNPWGALDIITNRERGAFEMKLHNDIKAYEEKLERQRLGEREVIQQEIKIEQEQIRPQSRGRRM